MENKLRTIVVGGEVFESEERKGEALETVTVVRDVNCLSAYGAERAR